MIYFFHTRYAIIKLRVFQLALYSPILCWHFINVVQCDRTGLQWIWDYYPFDFIFDMICRIMNDKGDMLAIVLIKSTYSISLKPFVLVILKWLCKPVNIASSAIPMVSIQAHYITSVVCPLVHKYIKYFLFSLSFTPLHFWWRIKIRMLT